MRLLGETLFSDSQPASATRDRDHGEHGMRFATKECVHGDNHLWSYARQPASRSAARTVSWNCGDSLTSGNRNSLSNEAHLGQRPLGRDRVRLDKELAMQRSRRLLHARAAATSPFSAAAHICAINFGATLAVTEITPWPPISISGNAVMSSPLYTAKSR